MTNSIRENAKKELGKWFAGQTKEQTTYAYKFFRTQGYTARAAIFLARKIVEIEVNEFAKQNFYGRSPF